MVPSRAVTRPEMMVSTAGVRLGTGAAARLSRAKAEVLNERELECNCCIDLSRVLYDVLYTSKTGLSRTWDGCITKTA